MSGSLTIEPTDSGGLDVEEVDTNAPIQPHIEDDYEAVVVKFNSHFENEIYAEAVELCREGLGRADRVLILIQEGNSLAVKGSYGSKAAFVIMKEEVSGAIIRRVRRKNRAIYINDALSDDDLGARQSIRRIGQRSVLCSPINYGGKNIGLLYADSISLIGAFTDADLRWSIRLTTALAKRLSNAKKEELAETVPAPAPHQRRSFAENLLPWYQVRTPKKGVVDPFAYMPRPKAEDKVIFLRSLACMITAGLPIYGALDTLAESGGRMNPFTRQMAQDVAKGMPLSSAFSRYPYLFGKDFVNLIAVGENSGTLDNVMETLAASEENNMVLRGKLLSALTYPTIILFFCFVGCMAAPPLFLNDFFATLSDANTKLPAITLAVMYASKMLWNPVVWAAMIFGVVILHAGVRALSMREGVWERLEQYFMRVAVLGEVYQDIRILKFARALGMQLEAGMYLDKSILLAADASGSPLLLKEAKLVVDRVHAGESFSFALSRSVFFPPALIEFIKVGEETARLGEMCRFVELLLSTKTEHSVETAQAMVEPLSMAFVGILVGVVAIACMLPLVQMIQAFL